MAALVLLAGCGPNPGRISVAHAWIRAPLTDSHMLAGYGEIENGTDQPATLQSVTSQSFAHISLHRTVIADGMARMEAVESLTLPAGGSAVLHPGGLHLMLMGFERKPSVGDRVELKFVFDKGRELNVTFTVRKGPPERENLL